MVEDTYIGPFWKMCYGREPSYKAGLDLALVGNAKWFGVALKEYDILLPDRKFRKDYGGDGTAKPVKTVETIKDMKATYEWEIINAALFECLMGGLTTTPASEVSTVQTDGATTGGVDFTSALSDFVTDSVAQDDWVVITVSTEPENIGAFQVDSVTDLNTLVLKTTASLAADTGMTFTIQRGPFNHEFTCGTPQTRPLPSAVIAFWHDLGGDGAYGASDTMLQYNGVRLPKFDLTFAEGEENLLKISADFWPTGQPTEPAAFPNADFDNWYNTGQMAVQHPYIMKKNSNLLNIWGSNYAKIISGRVTVDHQAVVKNYEEGEFPANILTGKCKFELELVIDIINRDIFERVVEQYSVGHVSSTIETDVTLSFARGTDTITIQITGATLNVTANKGELSTEATLTGEYDDIVIDFDDLEPKYPLTNPA